MTEFTTPPTPVQIAAATRAFLAEPYGPETRHTLLAADHVTVVAVALGCRALLDQLGGYLVTRGMALNLAALYSQVADRLDGVALEREYGGDA